VLRGLAVPIALFVLDGLVMGQGVLTALVAVGAVVVSAPLAVVARMRHREEAFLRHLRRAIVYPATAAVVIGFVALGNLHARRAADRVIAACDAYRTTHGRYPAKLDDLVPELLPSVPRAKPHVRGLLLLGGAPGGRCGRQAAPLADVREDSALRPARVPLRGEALVLPRLNLTEHREHREGAQKPRRWLQSQRREHDPRTPPASCPARRSPQAMQGRLKIRRMLRGAAQLPGEPS
jgi:hypothetical protein